VSFLIERKGQDPETYSVSDPSEIRYTDNDCVGDFARGFNDDACDRILPGSQLTLKTRVASITVKRQL
jgi:hypothetical protein